MTEHAYIRSIHNGLKKRGPDDLYMWKINDNYEGGIADAYYSLHSDLWVEYKFIKALPKRPTTQITVDLSELQKDWHRGRHTQGRRVCTIVGSPEGALILPGISWEQPVSTADFKRLCVDKRAVEAYILAQVQ